jgi:UDP-glucuronate decarboxylase
MEKTIKSLITGGSGFIGSHLCETLLHKGQEIYCLDNLATGNKKNIQHLLSHKKFHFIQFDIIQKFSEDLNKKLEDVKYIYHLASPASPPQYRRLAIETLRVNSEGTYHVLEIAKREGARFLLASTSEVYGDPLVHPQKEDYFGNVNSIGLRACYDEAKRYAEALTMEYFRKFKISVRIIRIFNTYGPRMEKEDGRVVSNFVNQALSGKPLTVYGDGNQSRSFCYIEDMIKGIVTVMEKDGIDGEVINLGNTNEKTINQIAKLITELTEKKVKIMHEGVRLGEDPQRRKPDISKAIDILNWQPKITLETGLKKTIDYFKSV